MRIYILCDIAIELGNEGEESALERVIYTDLGFLPSLLRHANLTGQ